MFAWTIISFRSMVCVGLGSWMDCGMRRVEEGEEKEDGTYLSEFEVV
jgi:hypothetical protein